MTTNYYEKYLKYKSKYVNLKNQLGGDDPIYPVYKLNEEIIYDSLDNKYISVYIILKDNKEIKRIYIDTKNINLLTIQNINNIEDNDWKIENNLEYCIITIKSGKNAGEYKFTGRKQKPGTQTEFIYNNGTV